MLCLLVLSLLARHVFINLGVTLLFFIIIDLLLQLVLLFHLLLSLELLGEHLFHVGVLTLGLTVLFVEDHFPPLLRTLQFPFKVKLAVQLW